MVKALRAALVAAVVLMTGCSSQDRAAPGVGSGARPTTTRPSLHYVSLGDSYSAGQGLPRAVQPCGRNPGAYPALVAPRAGLISSEHACNGATTADVLDVEQAPGAGRQLDAVTADADVVTISIGGNDIGFADVMTDCVLNSLPCTRLDAQVSRDLAALPARLDTIYREIHRRAPKAALLVVGYPQLVIDPSQSSLASCAGLTPDESVWVRQKGDELARVIRTAAEKAGARYLDSSAAFAGHEACTPQPWMEGVNFVNIAASFHPNATGQEQFAQLVAAALPNP